MINELAELPLKARQAESENKAFFKRLKKRKPKGLDQLMVDLHDAEFSRTDCLTCANCCKTTGPLVTNKDIERISRRLRLKPGAFIASYLRVDEDKDYVLKSLPCHFLNPDNSCSIYDIRPKACREYPHTDRRNIHQIGALTVKNTFICPAAFNIVESLKKRLQ